MLADSLERCIEAEQFKYSELEGNFDDILNLGCFVNDSIIYEKKHSFNFDLPTMESLISLVVDMSHNKFCNPTYRLLNSRDRTIVEDLKILSDSLVKTINQPSREKNEEFHKKCQQLLRKSRDKDESYWKYMQNFVYDTQVENGNKGNEDKADIIQNKLKDIMTYDSFFIMVYNHCDSHAFDYDIDQAIVSLNIGPSKEEQCNVILFRSRHWHRATDEEKETLTREVNSFKSQKILSSDNYEEFLKHQNGSAFHEIKLLAMVPHDRNIAIRHVNCETIPGVYETVTDTENKVFQFFAGFH
uniref:FTH domain-containing protein n=1 Tax=Caenorhabditis tropicalis TaxID=1561998 RepID=A0A1I7ULI8_9PELO